MLMAYYLHYGLYAIFYPHAVECGCIMYLTCYKVSQFCVQRPHVVGPGRGCVLGRTWGTENTTKDLDHRPK